MFWIIGFLYSDFGFLPLFMGVATNAVNLHFMCAPEAVYLSEKTESSYDVRRSASADRSVLVRAHANVFMTVFYEHVFDVRLFGSLVWAR